MREGLLGVEGASQSSEVSQSSGATCIPSGGRGLSKPNGEETMLLNKSLWCKGGL